MTGERQWIRRISSTAEVVKLHNQKKTCTICFQFSSFLLTLKAKGDVFVNSFQFNSWRVLIDYVSGVLKHFYWLSILFYYWSAELNVLIKEKATSTNWRNFFPLWAARKLIATSVTSLLEIDQRLHKHLPAVVICLMTKLASIRTTWKCSSIEANELLTRRGSIEFNYSFEVHFTFTCLRLSKIAFSFGIFQGHECKKREKISSIA